MPPSAYSIFPFFCASAPVNDPFSWPNSSLSSRFSGIAPQLMATNGLASESPAGAMDRPGDQLLPGPALPFDQHRGVGAGHLPDHREDPPHLRALPEDLPEPGGRAPRRFRARFSRSSA